MTHSPEDVERTAPDKAPCEFAFQAKFKRRDEFHDAV
jgi:hypothetical protein